MPDPADRLRIIREQVATEVAKRRPADHNGRPVDLPAEPAAGGTEPAPAEPASPRNPAPDPSQGSRGSAPSAGDPRPVPPGLAKVALIAQTRAAHTPPRNPMPPAA